MKLKLILFLFIALLAIGNTAKAQDEETKSLFFRLYTTILLGRSVMNDNFKSIQGDEVKVVNGKTFYDVKGVNSKVIKTQYIIQKENSKRSYMALIKTEYRTAVLNFITEWEKGEKVKNTVEEDTEGTFYSLKNASGGIVFNLMVYKDTTKESVISAY